MGNPVYNQYRSDIANLFPGYANSDGAVGYFYLDTTKYTNGVHTIQWTVTDDAGNTDGIGSRYFTIQNSGADSVRNRDSSTAGSLPEINLSNLTTDFYSPVVVVNGYGKGDAFRKVYPDNNGVKTVRLNAAGRLQLNFFPDETGEIIASTVKHRVRVLSPLPIGSTLDGSTGTFTWTAGPAHLGRFPMEFAVRKPDSKFVKTVVIVNIVPAGIKDNRE
ncbi:MAG: hypothetical protein GY940_44420 [bacterium]|nr:hypothetical protein [bacterium]